MPNSSSDPPKGIINDSRRMMDLKVLSSMNAAETSKAAGAATNVESRKRDIFGSFCRDVQSPQHHHTNSRYSESGDFYGNLNSLEGKIGKKSKSRGENIWNFSRPKHASRSPLKKYNMFDTSRLTPSLFDEVETTRICTTVVDSVVGLSGKHSSRYSQTTQSFLIKKQSDSNLFKDNHIFINSRGGGGGGGSDLGRDPFSKPNSLTPLVPNLHPFLDSKPSDKSRKGKMVSYQSESSAETHSMDLTNSEKIHGHGVNSSRAPVKVINLGFSTAPRLGSIRGEEDRLGKHKMKLPDMNLDAPTSSTDEQTLEYQEPITSRTQSLDKETVLSHAEHVNPLESVDDLHAGGRWFKRLKMNDSLSYSDKKRSDSVEKSHLERGNSSLKRFLESSMALASKNHGNELTVVDEATTLKTREQTSVVDSAKKDRELLLSKSWIRRWCHHEETPKKNPNAEIDVGEPRNSKLLEEGRNKKQLPSIGAMALMAKTVNCMETYDIRNRGAVMVWNTNKGF